MNTSNSAITRNFLLAILCLGLTNCGFVTTPLALASAEVASSTVKAADYGLVKGRQAAIYLRDQGVEGTMVTIELVESVVDDLDAVLRSEPIPAERSELTQN